MQRLRLFVPLILFCAIVVVGYVGFSLEDPHRLPSALLGKSFPEFRGQVLQSTSNPELAGQWLDQSVFQGKVSLVNVWATWCPTCAAEHDELLNIRNSAEFANLQMVGVNYRDQRYKAKRWLAERGDPFDMVIEDADGSLGIDLGVYGAPESFLVDADGTILYKRVGDINPRVWQEEILPVLQKLEITP